MLSLWGSPLSSAGTLLQNGVLLCSEDSLSMLASAFLCWRCFHPQSAKDATTSRQRRIMARAIDGMSAETVAAGVFPSCQRCLCLPRHTMSPISQSSNALRLHLRLKPKRVSLCNACRC